MGKYSKLPMIDRFLQIYQHERKGIHLVAIVNEIKCSRCDRKYSGVRARCPYCGARRTGYGKDTDGSNKDRVKMIVSVVIMAIFTTAAGMLLFTTPADADNQDVNNDNEISITSPDSDIDSIDGHYTEPTTDDPLPDESVPDEQEDNTPPEVQSATIRYSSRVLSEFTVKVGETVEINVDWQPKWSDNAGNTVLPDSITWTSSDEEKFQVVPVDLDRIKVNVTGIAAGAATLTVRINGVEETCTVYIT